MRRLAEYLKQCFCTHDWNVEEGESKQTDAYGGCKEGMKVYMRCHRCGYHKSHWKFL
jgi:hypothetical protein